MQENILEIRSLDAEGRGVGQLQNEDDTLGKVIFVDGALPGEKVGFDTWKRKPKWEMARVNTIYRESSLRVKPKCPYFGICGGWL